MVQNIVIAETPRPQRFATEYRLLDVGCDCRLLLVDPIQVNTEGLLQPLTGLWGLSNRPKLMGTPLTYVNKRVHCPSVLISTFSLAFTSVSKDPKFCAALTAISSVA